MKIAELLPSKVLGLLEVLYGRVLFHVVHEAHKPEVEGSSPSLDTTSFIQSKITIYTVYTAIVWYVYSLFLTKINDAVSLAVFLFSSFLPHYTDFYCRVTAESLCSKLYFNYYSKIHPP